MVKVFISKTRAKLEQIHILDIILEIKKVLQKKNLMTQLETKCQALKTIVQRFHFKFNLLNQRGLPIFLAPNDRLTSLEEYCQMLYAIATDKTIFAGIKGHLTGKEILEALDFDSIIKHEIKHIFVNKPTFEKYTEVDEVYRKLVNLSMSSEDRWDHLCEIIE